MRRHFERKKLINQSPIQITGLISDSVWKLPPYTVARFGGELSKVMLDAAEQYIYQKCLVRQTREFQKEAFHNKNLS